MPDTFHDGERLTRAKVWVREVTHRKMGQQGRPEATYEVEDVTLAFVNGNDPDSENAKYWDASPTSEAFHLIIANKAAHGLFPVGKEFYLDFVEAVRTPSDG